MLLKIKWGELMVEEKIKRIIAMLSNVDYDEITSKDELRSLGFDSLRMVELIITLEDSLNVRLDDTKLSMNDIKTVESLINLAGRPA